MALKFIGTAGVGIASYFYLTDTRSSLHSSIIHVCRDWIDPEVAHEWAIKFIGWKLLHDRTEYPSLFTKVAKNSKKGIWKAIEQSCWNSWWL